MNKNSLFYSFPSMILNKWFYNHICSARNSRSHNLFYSYNHILLLLLW